MPALRPGIRALGVGAGTFALVSVAAGGTFAASNPATLYACFDPYGNVRMGETAQCKLPSGGRLVSWSTAQVPGPTGPAGPTGAMGPAGPTGPTGPAGASGASSAVIAVAATINASKVIADCGPGMIAIGGGGASVTGDVALTGTGPADAFGNFASGPATQYWAAVFDGVAQFIDAYAVCVPQ